MTDTLSLDGRLAPLVERELPYQEKLASRAIVPMFAAPDPLSEQVSQALLGMSVLETAGRRDWRNIRTPDGYQGWVAAAGLVDPPREWGGPWAEVTDLWANLRARAGSNLAPVTQAVIGTRFPVVGEVGKWAELVLPDGSHVWTEGHRVQVVGEAPLRPLGPRAVAATARRFLGTPYLWGGCSPVGIDCSGFVQLVMRLHGIPLLRDASMQAEQGVPIAQPDLADLVFFGPLESPGKITHVGMMMDRLRFIHSAGSDQVRINRLTDDRYQREFRFGRRVLPRR
jgi:hypothetical protein